MTQNAPKMYRRLRSTVKMLASDATDQIRYLVRASEQAKFAILADDFATEFGCWHGYATPLAHAGLLCEHSLEELNKLSVMIETIPSEGNHWTVEALATSIIWADVRKRAGIALASMDEYHGDLRD